MSNCTQSKIFIVGLPRTGTTSVCAALLNQGFSVAHTAFSEAAFEAADVVADAPVFSEYPFLDKQFPGSKFILLNRAVDSWVPSIQKLLKRISERHSSKPTAFSPVLVRAYVSAFGNRVFTDELSKEELIAVYKKHRATVQAYFSGRDEDLMDLTLSQKSGLENLRNFLGANVEIPHLNDNGKISDWSRIKNPKKIDPNLYGRNGRKYFYS